MFFVIGLKAGFIIAITLLPAAIWIAKLGSNGYRGASFAAALACLLAQSFWFLISALGIFVILDQLPRAPVLLEVFSSLVLLFLAYRYFSAPQAKSLAVEDPGKASGIFAQTFLRALAMPIRLPLTMAVMVAVGTHLRYPGELVGFPELVAGAIIGAAIWWLELAFLAAVIAPRVSQPVTLRSLNRLRPLSALLFLILACITLLFLAGGPRG